MIWEYIKNEIRTFPISFSKQYAKDERTKAFFWKKKSKHLEANANFNFDEHYLESKNNVIQIYQEKANRIKIRSKYDWYEFGEIFPKFFLNLEKQHGCKTRFHLSFAAKMKLRIKTKSIINCIIFIKHVLRRNFKFKLKI